MPVIRLRKENDDHRQEQAHDRQRPPRTGRLHEQRRQQRADADREIKDRLHDAEHARQHVLGSDPLQQRESGHVHERVADADERERGDGDANVRPGGDGDERQPPEQRSDEQRSGESRAPHERHDDERAQQRPQTDGGFEQADSTLPQLEQAECGDDDQHVDAAGSQRLAGQNTGEQSQVGRAPCHTEAGEEELSKREVSRRARDRRCLLDRQHEQRRPEECDGHHDESGLEPRHCEHETGKRRPGEHAQALDRRGDDVCHRQLLGRSCKLRKQRDLRRPERRPDGRRQAGEDVHERRGRIGDDDDERPEHEHRPHEVAAEHHPDAAIAIPQRGRRGRGQRAQRPQDEDRADRGSAAFLVRPYAKGDLEPVVADDGAGPRDLEQPELAVAEDRRYRASPLAVSLTGGVGALPRGSHR